MTDHAWSCLSDPAMPTPTSKLKCPNNLASTCPGDLQLSCWSSVLLKLSLCTLVRVISMLGCSEWPLQEVCLKDLFCLSDPLSVLPLSTLFPVLSSSLCSVLSEKLMHPVLSKFFAWWSCSIVLLRTMETYLNDKSVSRPSNCYKCSLFAQSCQISFCLLKRSLFIFEQSLCSVFLKDHYAQFVWMIVSLLLLCMKFLSVIPLLVLFSTSAFLPLCFLFLFISSSPLSLAPPLPQFFLSPSSTWNSSLCHAVPSASSAWLSLIPLLLLSSARLPSLFSVLFYLPLLCSSLFSAWTASFYCAISFIDLTSENVWTYLKTHFSDNAANIYGRILIAGSHFRGTSSILTIQKTCHLFAVLISSFLIEKKLGRESDKCKTW